MADEGVSVFTLEPYERSFVIQRSIDTKLFHAHRHAYVEMIYILSGESIHYINGVAFPMSRGSLLVMDSSDIHMQQPLSDTDLISLQFQVRYLSDALPDINSIATLAVLPEFNGFAAEKLTPHIQLAGRSIFEFETLLCRMYDEYTSKKSGYETILHSGLTMLAVSYFRHCEERAISFPPVIRHVLNYIEANYYRRIEIAEIAQTCYYSPYYLSRLFKDVYGETISECVQRCRIMHAMNLLHETAMSVEDICLSVGYKEKKQFYVLFKQFTGVTPNKYRSQID